MTAVAPEIEAVDHPLRRRAAHAHRLKADNQVGGSAVLGQRGRVLDQRHQMPVAAEEAAKRRSEADEARKAVEKQLAEAREQHQQALYANQVGLAHRVWGHLEPKAGVGAKGAQKK